MALLDVWLQAGRSTAHPLHQAAEEQSESEQDDDEEEELNAAIEVIGYMVHLACLASPPSKLLSTRSYVQASQVIASLVALLWHLLTGLRMRNIEDLGMCAFRQACRSSTPSRGWE